MKSVKNLKDKRRPGRSDLRFQRKRSARRPTYLQSEVLGLEEIRITDNDVHP